MALSKHQFGDLAPRLEARHNDDFNLPVAALALGTAENPMAEFEDPSDLPVSRGRVNVADLPSYGGYTSERVAHAMEGYRTSPASVPPIVVVSRAGGYEIVDGHHRIRAARRVGKETLPAWVVHSPRTEAHPGFEDL